MPFASSENASLPKRLLAGVALLATVVVILGAIWTVGAAIMENILFAKATDQVLQLLGTTRNYASTDKNFGTRPDEDILNELGRGSLITGTVEGNPTTLINPWKGSLSAIVPAPSMIRIENTMPARDCRRLAVFFIKNGGDLGLSVLETRQENVKVWQRFFDRDAGKTTPVIQQVEDSCELAPTVTLALVFAIR